MTRRYRVIAENEIHPPRSIVLAIGGEDVVAASVMWTAPDGSEQQSATLGPIEALEMADDLCHEQGVSEILVSIQRQDLWQSQWGDLVRS